MAAAATIAIDRLELIKKLEDVLVEKQKEYDKWLEESKTYRTRLKAWEKKAVDYIRKNGQFEPEFLEDLKPDYDYRNQVFSLDFSVKAEDLNSTCGPRPEEIREPDFFNRKYNGREYTTPSDEIKNAIALYKLSTEPTVKVSTKTTWAGYLI